MDEVAERPPLERAALAVLNDLRDRKLLKYLFADDPENHGAYGYLESPIDADTQAEIAAALVAAVLRAMRNPSNELMAAGAKRLYDFKHGQSDPKSGAWVVWQAMIDKALAS